jgi:hypothetical protein
MTCERLNGTLAERSGLSSKGDVHKSEVSSKVNVQRLSLEEQVGANRSNNRENTESASADGKSPELPIEVHLWDELWQYYQEHATGSPLNLADHIVGALGAFRDDVGHSELWQATAFPLWGFLRIVKAHPDIHDATAKQAVEVIEKSIARWVKGKAPTAKRAATAWMDYFDLAREDAVTEIAATWSKIKRPYGASALDEAIARARVQPIGFSDGGMLTMDSPGYRNFLSVAGWLQVCVDAGATILLPLEKLSAELEVSTKTIARWRQFAMEDAFLILVEKHIPNRVATRFLFDISRVPMLRKAASAETIAMLGGDDE